MTKDIKMVIHCGDEKLEILGHDLHHNLILSAIRDAYKAKGNRWGMALFQKLSALTRCITPLWMPPAPRTTSRKQ